jgi:hypothetical protein
MDGRIPVRSRCNEETMFQVDEKLGSRDAARHLGLAPSTLAKMRCRGGSPTFLRLGRKIVYVRADLDAWLSARRAQSTSDADRLPRRLTDAPSVA